MDNPFRYFNSSPEVIRLVVMVYVGYPLSLRNVEDLLAERGIEISHEKVRFWWIRFGPMFAAEIRKRRVTHIRRFPQWRWHLDEVFVKARARIIVELCPAPEYRDHLKAYLLLLASQLSFRSRFAIHRKFEEEDHMRSVTWAH